jgi:hypothetical protein
MVWIPLLIGFALSESCAQFDSRPQKRSQHADLPDQGEIVFVLAPRPRNGADQSDDGTEGRQRPDCGGTSPKAQQGPKGKNDEPWPHERIKVVARASASRSRCNEGSMRLYPVCDTLGRLLGEESSVARCGRRKGTPAGQEGCHAVAAASIASRNSDAKQPFECTPERLR